MTDLQTLIDAAKEVRAKFASDCKEVHDIDYMIKSEIDQSNVNRALADWAIQHGPDLVRKAEVFDQIFGTDDREQTLIGFAPRQLGRLMEVAQLAEEVIDDLCDHEKTTAYKSFLWCDVCNTRVSPQDVGRKSRLRAALAALPTRKEGK